MANNLNHDADDDDADGGGGETRDGWSDTRRLKPMVSSKFLSAMNL